MAKFVDKGDSIEGKTVLINTRKQTFQTILKLRNYIFYKYKCSINSKAEITEEINPKAYQLKESSHLNLGDFLEAEVIEVLSFTNLKFHEESGYTGRHGIQTATADEFAFAEIFMPFRFILEKAITT